MSVENGEWVMHGLADDDPRRLKTAEDLKRRVREMGFLPLFGNEVKGFSAEEMTRAQDWWSDDPAVDPWIWRQILARDGEIAYGKFFAGKAGFISKEWLPLFVNWRRDGYDFDALWDDEKASMRQKRIMDLFPEGAEHFSFETKALAGFGKGGERNFEQTVSALQHDLYLVVRDFRQRLNKRFEPYGWSIAVYTTPETQWGYDAVHADYDNDPALAGERILARARELFPDAPEAAIRKILL